MTQLRRFFAATIVTNTIVMLKILHTADWHLGKRLDSFSRLQEQTEVMEEIIAIADQEEVHLVLIAGDLYDQFNPPVEAMDLFYKTVKRLSKDGRRPVIAIAGNHDAPSLIEAPSPLAQSNGIILIGRPNARTQAFASEHFSITNTDNGFIELTINGIDFPIRLLHTAYANEQRLKENLGAEKEDNLNRVLADNWNHMATTYCDAKGVNLLMAHLYMNKHGTALLEEPEGEKPIKIGNADMIYTEAIPEQIQYTALGHIHGFKNLGTEEKPIVYASSPLCYSFAEAGQTKYVNIIHAQPGLPVNTERIALKGGKQLHRKSFESVLQACDWLAAHPDTFVELSIITDSYLSASDIKQLYQSHEGIVYLIPIPKADAPTPGCSDSPSPIVPEDVHTVFRAYFKSKYNNIEPGEELLALLQEITNDN